MADHDDWWVLGAARGPSRLRVRSAWDGRAGTSDFRLPDGRDEDDFVASGDAESAPFPVWFEPVHDGGDRGDMIATDGSGYKIVSDRLLDALDDLDAAGYLSIPADLRDGEGARLPGYHLLHPLPVATGNEVRPLFGRLAHLWMFEVNGRVKAGLLRRGVDDLRITDTRVVRDHARRLVTEPSVLDAR